MTSDPFTAALWGALGGAVGMIVLAFIGGFILRVRDPRQNPRKRRWFRKTP